MNNNDIKLIYCTHPQTREFIGEQAADPDPLQPGQYLIPAYAYLEQPAKPKKGYVIRRTASGEQWEQVIDKRGGYYDTASGEVVEHSELGPLPAGLTIQAPPGPFHHWKNGGWQLDQMAAKASQIQQERDWRNQQLALTDGAITRHRDELESQLPTSLTAAQYQALQQYRLALRNWPQHAQFPELQQRPQAPEPH